MRRDRGDIEGALQDFNEVIRLNRLKVLRMLLAGRPGTKCKAISKERRRISICDPLHTVQDVVGQ
jgi:hypothetical protein